MTTSVTQGADGSSPGRPMRFLQYRLLVTLVVGVAVSGCASMPTSESIQGTMQKMSTGIQGGIGKLTNRGSGSSSEPSSRAALVVSQFPQNEVPHTLLKKPVAEGRLTSGHGYRFSPTGMPIPKKHKGIDYAAPAGTPIYAAGDGVIVKHYVSKSYGNYVKIEHENGFYTAYAHMQAFVEGQAVGSIVKKGEMIGNVGSTGRSSGPHLHYELIHGGNFIDPLFEIAPEQQQASVK